MRRKSKYSKDDPSDFGWQRYYYIEYVIDIKYTVPSMGKPREGFVILYGRDNENAGSLAHDAVYRTKRLAVKGANRLYRRMCGRLECALGLTNE